MTRLPLISIAALLVPAALAGCGGTSYGGGSATASNASSTAAVTSAKAKGPALKLRKTSLGKVLVDSRGRTLYMFSRDVTDKSRCSGACAQNWPPAASPKKPKVGAGVSKAKLKVIHRAGGSLQLSYAGHPLYRFILDNNKPGSVKGQGVNAFGGVWHVVSASGAMVANAPAPTAPPSMGGYGSGGY